jgi:tRNA modification GTPase
MNTITAITTMGTTGGVGMVRLSGPDALSIASSLFRPVPTPWIPRKMFFGRFISSRTGHSLDSGLIVWMKNPASFTGEDVIEFHCHGGDLNQNRILQATIEAGARLAEKGEFTRRAFLNDKLDLTQAEALMDVITADTQSALDAAHSHMQGALQDEVESIRAELLQIISHVEVNIDFLQEDVPLFDPEELAKRMDVARENIHELLSTYEQGKVLRDGLTVALAGAPNAGKSSLFNALLKEKRAIVTDIPGTTRDYLEEKLDLENLPLVLIDTAGVRETEDPIEREGVIRSHERIHTADLTLLLLDGSETPPDEPAEFINHPDPARVIVLRTKSDVPSHTSWSDVSYPSIPTSTITGEGIPELLDEIRMRYGLTEERINGKTLITRARHFGALERAQVALSSSSEALRGQMPFEIVAGELQLSLEAVGDIVGLTTPEDILHHIFGEFCIGK